MRFGKRNLKIRLGWVNEDERDQMVDEGEEKVYYVLVIPIQRLFWYFLLDK